MSRKLKCSRCSYELPALYTRRKSKHSGAIALEYHYQFAHFAEWEKLQKIAEDGMSSEEYFEEVIGKNSGM